jgi:hypothetical protein
MMHELRADYFEALGVVEFTRPTSKAPIKTTKHTSQKCICLVLENSVTGACLVPSLARDFLFKMLSAIDLSQHDICIDTLENLSKYEAQSVLFLTKKPSDLTRFSINHPNDILKNEALKREAWNTLKELKQWLEEKKK